MENFPIGVFDSGIGGLIVLNVILTIDRFNNVTHEPGPNRRADLKVSYSSHSETRPTWPTGTTRRGKTTCPPRNCSSRMRCFSSEPVLGVRSALSPEPRQATGQSHRHRLQHGDLLRSRSYPRCSRAMGHPGITVGVVAAGADGAIESLRATRTSGAVAVMATVGTPERRIRPWVHPVVERGGHDPPPVIQQGSLGLASAIEGILVHRAGGFRHLRDLIAVRPWAILKPLSSSLRLPNTPSIQAGSRDRDDRSTCDSIISTTISATTRRPSSRATGGADRPSRSAP